VKQFETIRFIRSIYIYYLNLHNPYSQGYKTPLKQENEYVWRSPIDQIVIYFDVEK